MIFQKKIMNFSLNQWSICLFTFQEKEKNVIQNDFLIQTFVSFYVEQTADVRSSDFNLQDDCIQSRLAFFMRQHVCNSMLNSLFLPPLTDETDVFSWTIYHLQFHFIFHTIENVIICNSEPYTREHFFCYFDSEYQWQGDFLQYVKKCNSSQRTDRIRNEWPMLKLAKREEPQRIMAL